MTKQQIAAIQVQTFGADAIARAFGVGMRQERRRHRLEARTNARGLSFRDWARRTYNVAGAFGKLTRIVSRRAFS